MNKIVSIEKLPNVFKASELRRNGKLSNRMVNYMLNKYIKEKLIIKLKRNLYSKVADPFYVATKLYNGYVGFSSALYLYRLKSEIETTVIICTRKTQNGMNFLDKRFQSVNMSKQYYGYSLLTLNDLDIPISTLPKTIFDMFYRPKYANFYDLYVAINNTDLAKKDWDNIIYYANNSNLATIRRLGYGLENKAPVWFTKKLLEKSRQGSRTSFFFSHKTINYNAKWDIFDDVGIRRWENAV